MGSAETGDHRGGALSPPNHPEAAQTFPPSPTPGLVGSAGTQDAGTLTWVPPGAVPFSEGRCLLSQRSLKGPQAFHRPAGPSLHTSPQLRTHPAPSRDLPSGEQLLDSRIFLGPRYPVSLNLPISSPPGSPCCSPHPLRAHRDPASAAKVGPMAGTVLAHRELPGPPFSWPLSPPHPPPPVNLQGSPEQVVCGMWGMCRALAPSQDTLGTPSLGWQSW